MRLFRRRDDKDRPHGPYYAVWYDSEGIRHERSTRAYDEKAAGVIARQFERDAADPDHATAHQATLSDALDMLLRDRDSLAKAGKRSAETVKFYRAKSGHLIRLFEQRDAGSPRVPFPLRKLKAAAVDAYIEQRRAEGAVENTIHKELTTLRASLKLAKRRGLWLGDIDAVVPPGFSPNHRPHQRNLPPDEVTRLVRELPPERAAIVSFIVATSAEWGVVEKMERRDVEADLSSVLLRGTKRETRFRIVPVVTPEQREMLKHAVDNAGTTEGLLFVPWSNVRRDLHDACRRAGCRQTGCLADPKRKAPCTREDCQAAALEPCSPNDLRRS
ncbi:MAG: hypothetical protein WCJ30_18470, partial [Deltaproteobacteria bacterium]